MLWSSTHVAHGKPDGESTTYWKNGRIRSVTKFVKRKEGKSKEIPKFDDPVPAVLLRVEADENLCTAWRHIYVDEYPKVLNLGAVRNQLEVPQFLLEVHERNRTFIDHYEDCNTINDGIA